MIRLKKKTLSPLATVIAIAVTTVVTELLSLYIQPWLFRETLRNILERPLLIPLNLFPVAVFTVIGYMIFKNAFWGSVPAALVLPLLSYVNLLKIEGRSDAFVPADVGLIREALTSATGYSLNLHLWLAAAIVIYAAALTALGFWLKSPDIRVLPRVISSVAVLVAFVLSVRFVYMDKKLYESFPVDEIYNIPFVFNTLGFNYCFLHNVNLYPVDKPEGYDKAQVEKWIARYTGDGRADAVKPDVIFVMGEAFCDVTSSDAFVYESEEQNPIWRFERLKAREQSVSGHIVVSNSGAGTANTEFDIMTGTPTNMISTATTSSFRVVHGKTPSLARVYEAQGYNGYFMHPGSSWFYNRQSVYSFFGVDDQVFEESFDKENDKKGNLISDEAFLRQLKSDIEARRGQPQFMYTVTLQNHQTYNHAKYGYDPALPPTKNELSQRAHEYMSVYAEGVRDTSDMVYELAEYLDTLDEPTVMVFFGDHLPNLGEELLTFKELGLEIGSGSLENRLAEYETPFLIYPNTAYVKECGVWDEPDGEVISDIYLGAYVYELTGFTGCDPYFDFLCEARRVLPVLCNKESIYRTADGYAETLSGKAAETLDMIDKWQYYRLKQEY